MDRPFTSTCTSKNAPTPEPSRAAPVLRAHLVRERGYDRSMVVTFILGKDGLFNVGPAPAWRLEWAPPSPDLTEFG